MHRFISVSAIVSFFIMLLIFPAASIEGASAGILLWYKKVLPVLLPFALASHLMMETNITGRLPGRWYVILMGFLCGYPMGALTAGKLTREGKMTPAEGQRLLLFCNQPSPMFLSGYLGMQCLEISDSIPLFVSAYLPPLILGIFQLRKISTQTNTCDTVFQPLTASIFEKAWFESCRIIVKIGGYIMIFSIIAAWMNQLLSNESLVRPIIIGTFEMTTGSAMLTELALPIIWKAPLGIFLVCFGGLSCLAQTAGCLTGSRLKLGSYTVSKFLCGICSAAICYILIR